MPIRQRGNGWQVDVKHKGKRLRETVYGTQEDAKVREAELRALLLGSQRVSQDRPTAPGDPKTLQDAYNLAKTQWYNTKGQATAESNAQQALEFFGTQALLSTLRAPQVNDFIKHLLEEVGNSTSTVNRKLSALSVMLRAAVDAEWIEKAPKIPRLKERKHRVVCFSPEEEQRIIENLEALGRPLLGDLVQILVDTGLRLGEARKLRWADVKLNAVEVIDTKNGEDRRVPLTVRASGILQRLKTSRRDQEGPFRGLDYGRDIRRPWDACKAAMNRQDDPHFVIHGLRHTFCSRLVQRGARLQVVKELAGHKTLNTTLRYAHLAPSNHEDAVALLETCNAE